jgi:uncharacterized protein (DUF433 family)
VVIRAFREAAVLRLTGLTKRRLQYWDEHDFVRPSLAAGQGRGHRRLYAFGDLVDLRVASGLRREGASLQRIRRVVEHLRTLSYEHPLTELKVWACEGDVYFEEAHTVRAGRRPEQVLASYAVPVQAIVDQLGAEIAKLDRRLPGHVERRRATLGHQLVFKGTRIPVSSVQRLRQDGVSDAEILDLYPALTPADLTAAGEEAPRPGQRAS